MDIAELLHRPVGRPYRKDGVNDLFHLGRQRVLDIQKIDHDTTTDTTIQNHHSATTLDAVCHQ